MDVKHLPNGHNHPSQIEHQDDAPPRRRRTTNWKEILRVGGLVVAAASATAGIIVWLQVQNDRSYATRVDVERQGSQIQDLKGGVSELQRQNADIIRSLGRIEGKLEQPQAQQR